jgi:hypothetical protein
VADVHRRDTCTEVATLVGTFQNGDGVEWLFARRTDELLPGDRLLINGRYIRTVATVRDSGWLNFRDEPIFSVRYAEGDTAEWSGGNSGIASSLWTVAVAK